MDPRSHQQQYRQQPQQPQPQQQQQQQPSRPSARPHSKSGFSFRSGSSEHSHKRKESLIETAAEKRKTQMSQTTKANPNAAINEAQPIALALEKPTISGLQGIRCSDIYGNPINDPDRSNPTRWRMERPLDTIKSFELAIDKAYATRQSSYYQNGPSGMQSRRTSYMGNNQGNAGYDQANRSSNNNGYQGNSRDSFVENGNGYNGYNGQQGPPPGQYRNPNGYGQQPSRSKDTLNTGGSNGSDQWNNSTAPTSDEGSYEKQQGIARPPPSQQHSSYATDGGYGNHDNGYEGPGYQRGGYGAGGPPRPPPHMSQQQQGYQDGGPAPRPLPKDPRPQPPTKNVIRLSQTSVPNGAVQPVQEQRSSWFKKRFSRGK